MQRWVKDACIIVATIRKEEKGWMKAAGKRKPNSRTAHVVAGVRLLLLLLLLTIIDAAICNFNIHEPTETQPFSSSPLVLHASQRSEMRCDY